MNEPITLHARVLALQIDVKALKNAAYADHRLIEKMNQRITQLEKKNAAI